MSSAACVLLVACTGDPGRDTAPTPSPTASESPSSPATFAERSPSATATPTPRTVLEGLPTVPPRRDATALAGHLDRVAATLRNPDARTSDVRRAGEFQQLATRALASRSDSFRRKVMSAVAPKTARLVRGDVRAAMLLQALTTPQDSLPSWRIVEPPSTKELRRYYRQAQRRTGVPWNYLAAIHLVETRMGRIRGVSSAGARGPMQFLPSTWDLYGAGGDIKDPQDAIHAAARLLKANGAPGSMREALWHYNPSDSYVGAVSRYARTMQRWPSTYRGYWHWRVLYRHRDGVYMLPVGYPKSRAFLLREG